MKHDETDATETEPHVFDQTNGVVDLEQDGSADPKHGTTNRPDNRTVAGVAMWSANHF
jgi:hypothetical protein